MENIQNFETPPQFVNLFSYASLTEKFTDIQHSNEIYQAGCAMSQVTSPLDIDSSDKTTQYTNLEVLQPMNLQYVMSGKSKNYNQELPDEDAQSDTDDIICQTTKKSRLNSELKTQENKLNQSNINFLVFCITKFKVIILFR